MDQQVAPSADGAAVETPISVVTVPGDNNFISPSSAGRALAQARAEKRAAQAAETPAVEAPPPAPESTSQEGDAAPEQASGETGTPDPVELPPIEPPRSWTKEDKELFKGLPRETQERLADRERSRDTDFSRRQQEATERAKALEAERSKAEQVRTQYEQALPILLQNLQAQMSGEFSDIKSYADIEKMAAEDWPRYIRWDARQKQIAAMQQEVTLASQRQESEKRTKLQDFMQKESELLLEKVPEFADETQRSKLQSAAVTVLKDLGFKDEELGRYWRGDDSLSVHDHRFQLLLRDAVKWRDAQAQAKAKVAQKPNAPPVQRPGVAPDKGVAQQAVIQNLGKQLDGASGLNAVRRAAELVKAQRAARR